MIKRKETWPQELDKFLNQKMEFDWVELNCGFFVADAVKNMTGIDFAEPYRNLKTKKQLISKLKSYGGIEGYLSHLFGASKIWRFAKRGDVGKVSIIDETGNNDSAFGICTGSKWAVLGKTGIVFYPLNSAEMIWTV